MENSVAPIVLVVTGDEGLLDHALAACAAAGVEADVVADPGDAGARWHTAALVMIGADQADRSVAAKRRRGPMLLLDVEPGRDLAGASIRLGAAVVLVPGGGSELASAVSAAAGRPVDGGRVLAVVGGSGGVGTSTVASALSFVAARAAHRALLVDLDPLGGGIDLLLGAERVPGWRWPRLVGARGQLGDLTGQLPNLDGVDVVSVGRGPGSTADPSPAAVAAVVRSGARSHDLVVLDVGRGTVPNDELLGLADLAVLLIAADVRGVAAGRESHARWVAASASGVSWHLLLRRPRSGGLRPATAAAEFGAPLAGVVDDDPSIGLAAERGEPPARAQRSQLAKVCRHMLEAVVWPGPVAP
jgi:secretion/DNA translocation related CpaE-like protein